MTLDEGPRTADLCLFLLHERACAFGRLFHVPRRDTVPHPEDLLKPRVLLVDPDEDTRAIFGSILEHHGYDVREAAHGRTGLLLAQRWHPHAIVTELSLPYLDGVQLLRALRGDLRTSEALLIVVTTDIRPERRQSALAAGYDEIHVKPFSPASLLRSIREGLREPAAA